MLVALDTSVPLVAVLIDPSLAALEGRALRQDVRLPRAGEIVSEDRAARSLPFRRSDAVAWLRREGLSSTVEGRRVVVWDRVLARLGAKEAVRDGARRASTSKEPELLAEPGRVLD